MGKKETKIILDQSDDQCVVELEPLNPDQSIDESTWKRNSRHEDDSSLGSSSSSDNCQECESKLGLFYKENKSVINGILSAILLSMFLAYFVVACYLDFDRARDLFIVTMVSMFFFLYYKIKGCCGDWTYKSICLPMATCVQKRWKILRWVWYVSLLAIIGLIIGFDTIKQPKRLVSVAGLLVYIGICYFCSKYRRQIRWRPVLWGIGIQFTLGFLVLRTRPGFLVFKWLGDRVARFLSFSDAGAKFVFGDNLLDHPFAFKVLPVVVFFSSVIYVTYYLGVMQAVITKIAWLMQCTLGTSAAESLNTAGNIFIGQTEAPLLIRPFLPDLTMSELHAVMTSGFATIAGSVLGAYISFGVPATHLLSACVMNAPAALAISKLVYPEIETPKTNEVDKITVEKGKEKNLVEALAAGASMSITLIANIAVNLMAFVAVLAFVDAILMWLGGMVGVPTLSFSLIASYLCMPLAYIMGVEWNDAFEVGKLLGIKTFLNEFVAYKELAKMIENREKGLAGPKISPRSEAIVTYALCGFANISSVGVQIGGLSALSPNLAPKLAKIAFRALFAGTVACFTTACIAGILYDASIEGVVVASGASNSTLSLLNSTLTPFLTTTVNTTFAS
ncbi:solute carrier family 28 member 3-like [Rhopilema esculentum]|uniref:solute carrier family 28 member 3-like n=1 Tax=Rhopilema esculentum TaxID=499914 RepID=UPI0031D8008B|eukprot:gene17489-9104_t